MKINLQDKIGIIIKRNIICTLISKMCQINVIEVKYALVIKDEGLLDILFMKALVLPVTE